MKHEIRICKSPEDLAEKCADEFINIIRPWHQEGKIVRVALSGGNTPGLFFSFLAEKYGKSAEWDLVHFFWGDERCVPPDDPESNYGSFRENFMRMAPILGGNIHRIRGEDDPSEEAKRYAGEIWKYTSPINSLPYFDINLLGIGEDGHTASIFPDRMELLDSDRFCDVAVNPFSGQKRITLTGKVINNSGRIIFLVAGEKKASVVNEIIKEKPAARHYPAFYIFPVSGTLTWMLDEKAAQLL